MAKAVLTITLAIVHSNSKLYMSLKKRFNKGTMERNFGGAMLSVLEILRQSCLFIHFVHHLLS